jgi:energy-coupling factor transporter ATP-binding protein EcfA2
MLIDRISAFFTPSIPVASNGLFAGRETQIRTVVESIAEPGRHIILYGERGVGKTSLAKLAETLPHSASRRIVFTRKVCSPSDDFDSIWRKLFDDMKLQSGLTFGHDTVTPDAIVRHLKSAPATDLPIFVIDEFDEVANETMTRQMANTIKVLSDEGLAATIIVVGLPGDVTELVKRHPSIARCVDEILVPRMSDAEVSATIEMRLAALSLTMQPGARQRIVSQSQGFPAQVHRLARLACLNAVKDLRTTICEEDVIAALSQNQTTRRN